MQKRIEKRLEALEVLNQPSDLNVEDQTKLTREASLLHEVSRERLFLTTYGHGAPS